MKEVKGITRVWTREVPPEWEAALRDISPVSRVVPWLSLWWHPMVREVAPGTWRDAGRWLLHECVPFEILPASEQQWLAPMVFGPPARLLPKKYRYGREIFLNDYQWAMFHAHRVYARQLWIIQGLAGGHATRFEEPERDLLRAKGLPQEPPLLGELPYAPFDARVRRQMLNRNRLIRFGNNLDTWKRSANPEEIDREWKEDQRAYRTEYAKWLYSTIEPQVEFWQNYSRTMECRNTIPAASREQMDAASQFHDQYVDTGTVPHAPMVAG